MSSPTKAKPVPVEGADDLPMLGHFGLLFYLMNSPITKPLVDTIQFILKVPQITVIWKSGSTPKGTDASFQVKDTEAKNEEPVNHPEAKEEDAVSRSDAVHDSEAEEEEFFDCIADYVDTSDILVLHPDTRFRVLALPPDVRARFYQLLLELWQDSNLLNDWKAEKEELFAQLDQPGGHFRFLELSPEIRILIYEYLLPRKRVIKLKGKDQRETTFGPLSWTCKMINAEIKDWFYPVPSLQRRFHKTIQYGLIDMENTTFEFRINRKFRKKEECQEIEGRNFPFLPHPLSRWMALVPRDYAMIRKLSLHFETEDIRDRHHNRWAIKTIKHLPNLRHVVIQVDAMGREWPEQGARGFRVRNFWRNWWTVRTIHGNYYWIPFAKDCLVALEHPRNIGHDNRPLPAARQTLLVDIFAVWLSGPFKGERKCVIQYPECFDRRRWPNGSGTGFVG
jgi:hypothetical protein